MGGLKQEQKQDCSRKHIPDSLRGGLTQEQRQEYSREDIPDSVFRGGVLVAKAVVRITETQVHPRIPDSFIRGSCSAEEAVEYYNSYQCNKKYYAMWMPIRMKTKVVGGGYLDFITLMCREVGGDAHEKLQAIVYTGPGPEEVCEVLMCRPLLSSSPDYFIKEG